MKPRPTTAADLAREECALFVAGGCAGDHPCGVLVGQRCSYFEAAVLPAHPNVVGYGESPSPTAFQPPTKRCERCGAEFVPGSNRSRWCPDCAATVRREQTRRAVARHRAVM